jgi:hypothetical protein
VDGGVVPPSREDGVVRAASEVVGGPAGVHLADRGTSRWSAGPALALAASGTVALALLTRVHCRSTGWASPGEYVHACYSDVPALVSSRAAAGQPPGTAVLLRVLALVAPSPRGAFDASVLLAAAALVAAVLCLARLAGARRWDAALVALSPVVVTAGLVSVDLVAVALLSGALLAWARARPVTAGVLLGGAAAVRPAVALVLVAVWMVVLVRPAPAAGEPAGEPGAVEGAVEGAPPGAVAAGLATVGALGTAWVLTLLSQAGTAQLPGGSSWLAGTGGAGYGSVWLLPSLPTAHPHPLAPSAVTALSALALLAVLLAGVAAAVRTARSDPRGRAHLPAVALVLVAGAVALAPSVPVQATLVVLPLAALAAPRWRDHLPWAGAEVAYATGTWLYVYAQVSPDHRGLPPWAYATLLVLRLATLAWLVVQGVRGAAGQGAPADGAGEDAEDGAEHTAEDGGEDGAEDGAGAWGRAERAGPGPR